MTKQGKFNTTTVALVIVTGLLTFLNFNQETRLNGLDQSQVASVSQDSTFAKSVNQLDGDVKSIIFDVNRSVTYLAEQADIPIDSVWAFVKRERTRSAEARKAQLEAQKAKETEADSLRRRIQELEAEK